METQEIASTVRGFIRDNYLLDEDRQISADESLLEGGVIDSFGVLVLISFLEDTFEIRVQDAEVTPDNLGSVGQIVAYVERKLSLTQGDFQCA